MTATFWVTSKVNLLPGERRSGGVTFYEKDGVYLDTPINLDTETECSIIKIWLDEANTKNVCVTDRLETFRVKNHLDHSEKLIYFLNPLSSETVKFGDLKVTTIKTSLT